MFIEADPLSSAEASNKCIVKALPAKARSYHVCRSGCMLFTADDQRFCNHCEAPRFKDGNRRQPAATMNYLPLGELLGSMLVNEHYRDMFRQTYNHNKESDLTDTFDGSTFEKYEDLFQGEFDTAVGLYVDSFTPFRYNKNKIVSMTIIHLTVFNLPVTERYASFKR